MKRHKLPGTYLAMGTTLLVSLIIVTATLMSGCKKDETLPQNKHLNRGSAAAVASDEDETVYSNADYQTALNDVEVSGGHLEFKNTNHFATVAFILDSLGDSTADLWFQGIGFTSLYKLFRDDLNSMPEDMDETANTAFFSSHENTIHYNATDENWDVNASCGMIARLLNNEHKAVIGGNVFYSDYNVHVTVAVADEAQIEQLRNQAEDQNDENAIVLHQHTAFKTTGLYCVPQGQTYTLNSFSCGSPLQKRSLCEIQSVGMIAPGNYYYTFGIVNIKHQKRGAFGFWYGESRGSQLSGTFNGQYFWQQKVWGNSDKYHTYCMCFNWGWVNVCATDMAICVAPMCGGVTSCQYW